MEVSKTHRYCHTPYGFQYTTVQFRFVETQTEARRPWAVSSQPTLSQMYRSMGFQISPYLQEIVVFSGQNHVFEDTSQQLARLSGVEVSAKQVERLTHAYGELVEKQIAKEQDCPTDQKETLHYCMVNGGMVLTQEDDCKEMKLSRIFQATAHMAESEKRNFIKTSSYTAHLGGPTPFFKKLEKQTDPLKNMVWICDGAKWIWPPWNGIG